MTEREPLHHGVSWPEALVGLGLVGILIGWLARPIVAGDTVGVVKGTDSLRACLAALNLFFCKPETSIGPWPILQYVPDLVGNLAGLATGSRLRALAFLSSAGIVAAVAASWVALRRSACPEWRWVFLLIVVSGPPLAYGATTWGEMLAAGLTTVFVAAALLRARPAVVGLAAFAAGLTKETAYPFILALGLMALMIARRRTGAPILRHVVFALGGLAAALALNGAFNMLRFGTPKNAYYLDPALRTTTVNWFLELAGGLLVSPNGGIVFFWPAATALVAALLAVPAWAALRRRGNRHDTLLAVGVFLVAAGLVAGLAAWWQPFGWWAWGPRLSLPWVLPIVLLCIAAFGESLTPIVRRLLSPAGVAVAAVAIVLVALPHAGYLAHPDTVGQFFFRDTSVCPAGGPPPDAAYYACLREELWTRHPIWLESLVGLKTVQGAGAALATALVVLGCLVLFRREVLGRGRDRDDGPPGSLVSAVERAREPYPGDV